MSTIYLIRHGQTKANENHLYCGSTDLPLSEAGIAELSRLRYHIQDVRFLTSGMKRADETLRILFGNIAFEADPRFREMDFGKFEMHGYEALRDDPEYQCWITGDNEANVTPGGESGEQMCCRVFAAFAELQAAHEDILVVTHGGVIAAIMAWLFPLENKNRYQWQPKPGYGYAISDGHYRRIPEVLA